MAAAHDHSRTLPSGNKDEEFCLLPWELHMIGFYTPLHRIVETATEHRQELIVLTSSTPRRPALVDAITGLRYVIIFGATCLFTLVRPRLLREDFSGAVLFGKTLATAMVVAGQVLVGLHGSGPESETVRLLPPK